jgi:hypothetical protein
LVEPLEHVIDVRSATDSLMRYVANICVHRTRTLGSQSLSWIAGISWVAQAKLLKSATTELKAGAGSDFIFNELQTNPSNAQEVGAIHHELVQTYCKPQMFSNVASSNLGTKLTVCCEMWQ